MLRVGAPCGSTFACFRSCVCGGNANRLLACGLPPLPVAAPVLVLATAVFAVVLFPLLPPLPVVAPLIALAAAVFAVVLLPLLPPLPVAAP